MSNVSVSQLLPQNLEQLRHLLIKSPNKPFRFLGRELKDELDLLWLDELGYLMGEREGTTFVALSGPEVLGTVSYVDLPWDTKVIQKQMGELKYLVVEMAYPQSSQIVEELLNHVISWATSRGVECLVCKPYTNDMTCIHQLEKDRFLLVDTLLDYAYDFQKQPLDKIPVPRLPKGYAIRPARANDVQDLLSVAKDSFGSHFGRFHCDQRIPDDRATLLYQEWVESSLAGYADCFFVAEIDHRIAGYAIWKEPAPSERKLNIKVGHYSVAAVHPAHSGQGLFGALTYVGMQELRGIVNVIHGPTHVNNYPVQRQYAKLGWHICDARHSFHKWLAG